MLSEFSLVLRGLLRAKSYMLGVTLTLVLGLSASLSMFALVWHVLYRSLPIAEIGELHELERIRPGSSERNQLTGIEARDLARYFPSDIQIGSYFWNGSTYTGGERALPITTISASASLFTTLQTPILLGRHLNAADEGSNHIVLTHSSWRRLFAGDPLIIGKEFKESTLNRVVVGVLPESFELIMPSVTYFAPIDFQLQSQNQASFNNAAFYFSIARIPAQYQSQFKVIAAHAATRMLPLANYAPDDFQYVVASLFERKVGDVRAPLNALLGLGVLVLLITLANAMHLSAARSAERGHQFAVRAALGASWAQQVRQLLLENLLLTSLAGVSVLLILFGLQKSLDLSVTNLPLLQDFSLGPPVYLALAAAMLLLTIAMLILPLMFVKRTQALELREKNAITKAGALGGVHRWLTVPAVACSLLAMATGFLYWQSAHQLQNQHLGLDIRRTATTQTWLQGETPEVWKTSATQLLDAARAIPQATAVGLTNRIPFTPTNNFSLDLNNGEVAVKAFINVLGGSAFQVLGYELKVGRQLSTADDTILVNQSFVERYFGDTDPINQFVSLPPFGAGEARKFQVLGVVADARTVSPAIAPAPEVFVAYERYPVNGIGILVQSLRDPRTLLRDLGGLIENTLPGQIGFRTYAIADDLHELSASARFFMRLANGFAALALLMALVGIYALLSFDLRLRRKEFALRAAIGASPGQQIATAGSLTGKSFALGCVLGCSAFAWFAKLLQPQIFGELNPWLAGSAALLAIGLGGALAILWAARSTLRLDLAHQLQRA